MSKRIDLHVAKRAFRRHLSERATNCLLAAGFRSKREVLDALESDFVALLKIGGLGPKTEKEILDWLGGRPESRREPKPQITPEQLSAVFKFCQDRQFDDDECLAQVYLSVLSGTLRQLFLLDYRDDAGGPYAAGGPFTHNDYRELQSLLRRTEQKLGAHLKEKHKIAEGDSG